MSADTLDALKEAAELATKLHGRNSVEVQQFMQVGGCGGEAFAASTGVCKCTGARACASPSGVLSERAASTQPSGPGGVQQQHAAVASTRCGTHP